MVESRPVCRSESACRLHSPIAPLVVDTLRSRKLGSTEVDVRGSRKSREISAVDLYAAPTKNLNNSTNIDPLDLIRQWEHDATILYLSNASFELVIVNGSVVKPSIRRDTHTDRYRVQTDPYTVTLSIQSDTHTYQTQNLP